MPNGFLLMLRFSWDDLLDAFQVASVNLAKVCLRK